MHFIQKDGYEKERSHKTQGRDIGRKLSMAASAGISLLVATNALAAWTAFVPMRYPTEVSSALLSPTENCQNVYARDAPFLPEHRGIAGAHLGDFVVYLLNEPWHTRSWVGADGAAGWWAHRTDGSVVFRIDEFGRWIGNPIDPKNPGKFGICMMLVPDDRVPWRTDTDYSGGVIDHEWYPEFVFPIRGGALTQFPPPFPPPPQFSDGSQILWDTTSVADEADAGRRTFWVEGFRPLQHLEGDKVITEFQRGRVRLVESIKSANGE